MIALGHVEADVKSFERKQTKNKNDFQNNKFDKISNQKIKLKNFFEIKNVKFKLLFHFKNKNLKKMEKKIQPN